MVAIVIVIGILKSCSSPSSSLLSLWFPVLSCHLRVCILTNAMPQTRCIIINLQWLIQRPVLQRMSNGAATSAVPLLCSSPLSRTKCPGNYSTGNNKRTWEAGKKKAAWLGSTIWWVSWVCVCSCKPLKLGARQSCSQEPATITKD